MYLLFKLGGHRSYESEHILLYMYVRDINNNCHYTVFHGLKPTWVESSDHSTIQYLSVLKTKIHER